MPDKSLDDSYIKFVFNLTSTIRKLSLYSAKHPTVVSSIKNLYSLLQEILNKNGSINIGLSSDKQVLIEDQSIGEKGSGLMQGLAGYFKKIDIENLTFQSGITEEELSSFFGFVLMEPEELKKIGSLSKAFLDSGIRHIKIAQFSYVKIEKGKKAVGVDEARLKLLQALESRTTDYTLGKLESPGDVQNLEKDILNMVTAEFKDKGKLSSGTKNILTKFLIKTNERERVFSGLADALSAAGYSPDQKDKFVNKLRQEVLKKLTTGKLESPGDVKNLEKDILNMVTAEFKDKGKLSSGTKNILTKFLIKTNERERVFSGLADALSAAGYSPEQKDKFVNKLRQEISEKITTREQKAGPAEGGELGELKAENEDLKKKLSRLQKEVASKAAELEKLAKEKKVINQEKERIDNIVHHMAEGMVVVDPQGKIIMANPVAEKLLDIGKDALGVPLSKTVKDEHLLTVVKNISPDKDGMLQKDIELFSPDDSTKKVLRTSSAVVEDHNGKTVGMVTVLNDITRQKEIERMKSDFVSNVSHELRTPMATIHQNISLLMEGLAGVMNENQMKFLNIAQDNMQRLKRLINDLLDSAAIESGKFKLSISKAKVNERIDNVVTFLSRWAESKKITIQANLLASDELLEMDKDRVEQVLTNLISNAIKFTPEGGKITVSVASRAPCEEAAAGAVEFSIEDTGTGIAPENIKKVFQRFERAGAATSGVGGTGLGLSICQQIVSMHGGKVWVESKLNEGSKFSFLLPRGSASAA
ncbi:ATP-binding protein [Candidatus Omnitrophota bacterium]